MLDNPALKVFSLKETKAMSLQKNLTPKLLKISQKFNLGTIEAGDPAN